MHAGDEMKSDDELAGAAGVFNAMGNLVRLRILKMLLETKKPLHIRGVARSLKIDYAAIYRHVMVLRASKLIVIYEVGRSRVLSPTNKDALEDLIRKGSALSK